jgi:hypothetical protein
MIEGKSLISIWVRVNPLGNEIDLRTGQFSTYSSFVPIGTSK